MSREDLPLERSLWRTEGRADGPGRGGGGEWEAGGSVNSLQLSWRKITEMSLSRWTEEKFCGRSQQALVVDGVG